MRSVLRRILAMLVLASLVGCQGAGRSASPWRVQRGPTWSPPNLTAPNLTAPNPQRSTARPPAAPNSRSAPAQLEKPVPTPTPDPRRKPSATILDEINRPAGDSASPGSAEQPQIRFKPVSPQNSLDNNTNKSANESLPPLVIPKRNDVENNNDSGSKLPPPSLGFEAISAPQDSPLNVEVRGQRQRPVGGSVTFDVIVRNHGTETLTGVLVNVEFDEALVFPGREEKRVKRDLGRILPGQSREMRLTLASHRLGKHACRFSVAAEGIAPIEKASTVEFINPKLQLSLIGPARRTVGSRAEFTVKIANSSDQAIDDLQVTLNHDATLTPHIATGGFQRDEHQLRWSLGRLGAGEGVQVQAEFDCRQLSEQACVTAEARSDELSAEAVETCVTVVAVPGLLDLRVSDRTDPVKVGEEAEYEVTVQNLGLESVSEVHLDVQTSEHLRASTHEAKIGERAVTLTTSRRDGKLRFVLSDSLPADATLRITLRATALQSGDAELRIVASPGADGNLVETSEFTSINP